MNPAALLALAYRAVMARRTPLAQLCPDVWVVLCAAKDGPPFVYGAYYGSRGLESAKKNLRACDGFQARGDFRFWIRRYEGSREVIDGLGAEETP